MQESGAHGDVCNFPPHARPLGMRHSPALARTVLHPAAVATLCIVTFGTACATARQASPESVPAARPQGVGAATAVAPPGGTPVVVQSLAGRMLIRRASMQLEVESPAGISSRVTDIAARLGGYVERSRESSSGGVDMTVRVPEPSLEQAMEAVSQLGQVKRRDISADDVTERVVDLTARAGTLRAMRDRLRELLARAESISSIITVEQELARVQAELDSIEQRLEYLRSNTALAALDVGADRERRVGPITKLFVGVGRLVGSLF